MKGFKAFYYFNRTNTLLKNVICCRYENCFIAITILGGTI